MLFDPCKKCLVRPCCVEPCSIKKEAELRAIRRNANIFTFCYILFLLISVTFSILNALGYSYKTLFG